MKSAAKAFSAGDAKGDKAGEVGGKFRSDGEVGAQFEDAGEYRYVRLVSLRTTSVLIPLGAVAGGTFSSRTGGKVGSQFEKDGAVGGVRVSLSLSRLLESIHLPLLPCASTDRSEGQ